MTFTLITLVYLIIYAIRQIVELRLEFLNAGHMRAHRNAIPEYLAGKMDMNAYTKAIDYQLAGYRFDLVSRFFHIAIHWLFIIAGFQLLDSHLRAFDLHPYLTGLLFFGAYSVIGTVLNLSFSIYHDFVLEERFGFNRKTWRVFVTDMLKSAALGIVIGTPLILVILWLMQSTGTFWWVYGIVFILAFQLLMLWLAPALILPLFNKMTPLEGELKNAITDLSRSAGFPAKEVLTMDGSRRSAHANAFFTGIGRLKKIVFFDTLLEKINPAQTLGVLAHEIGHHKLGHVRKKLALMATGLILFFGFLALLKEQIIFYPSLGFQTPSDYAALVIFSVIFQELTFPFHLLLTRLSRKHEYASDAFAVALTNDPDSLIEALEILHTTNMSAPVVHPAYAAFHYSHPDLPERIDAIRTISTASITTD